MRLSIIIVNTSEWHVLQPCLASVYRETGGMDFEVIAVDNASRDGSPENIAREFPAVRVVRNPTNMGFAASNNRGIREAKGDFVLLLNPDTVVLDGAINKTLAFMESHPAAGISGCILELKDGSIQESLRSFPTLWNVFCESTFLYRLFPKTKTFGQYYMTNFHYDTVRKVDWLCGAYFMIRREVLDKIGMLDEQFYMYTEEVDYCYRASQAGYETWFIPGAKIIHYWGGVSAAGKRVIAWSNGSQMLFFQKHFKGVKKILLETLKCWGLLNRAILFALLGIFTVNKQRLQKGAYHALALGRILKGEWKYRNGYSGPVPAWRQ
jgi:GT2 family glycosyltransferase